MEQTHLLPADSISVIILSRALKKATANRKPRYRSAQRDIIPAMEGKPAISLIMPVYESAGTLAAALDSALNQDFALPFEIILAVDRGRDASLAIAESYASRFPNIVIHAPAERMGPGLARLQGLALAQGDYFGFMDADDLLASGFMRTLHETMIRTGADCANCSFYIDDVRKGTSHRYPLARKRELDAPEALRAFFGDAYLRGFLWTKMFRRPIAEKRPLLLLSGRKDMFEDVALACSLLSHCAKIVTMKEPLYHYRKGIPTSAMSVPRQDRALEHLKVLALERVFLEKDANPALAEAFRKRLFRSRLSLSFDLRLDAKNGADASYRRLVRAQWALVKDFSKPLDPKGTIFEELCGRAFFNDPFSRPEGLHRPL
jgi:glycosyltransferase involved in cell wall biosynthesis